VNTCLSVIELATFDRETWRIACALVRRHGNKATIQAQKATAACLAERDLTCALANMFVAEAITVLLKDKPGEGGRVH
jgi:hypothetical protein